MLMRVNETDQCGVLERPWVWQTFAMLGPVLCLWRTHHGDVETALKHCSRLHVEVRIDSEGIEESLALLDPAGRQQMRLYRLPDSDFLTWENLCEVLPCHDGDPSPPSSMPLCGRLLHGLLQRRQGSTWQACYLQWHEMTATHGGTYGLGRLVMSHPAVSTLGRATARRLLAREGYRLDGME